MHASIGFVMVLLRRVVMVENNLENKQQNQSGIGLLMLAALCSSVDL